MSVIRKKPFIEEVVELLTISQKEELLSVMNTAGNNVEASLLSMPDKGIEPVLFKFDEANVKTGILIYLNDVPVTLIAYHRFQDVLLFRLYPDKITYEKVNEYCDINELRRILDATIDSISSGEAEENTILAADGEGGSSWVKPAETIKDADVQAGNAQTILAFDEEGNVVKSAVPTGTVTVDGALSDESENPVQNKVIKAALDDKVDTTTTIAGIDLQDDIESYELFDALSIKETFATLQELDTAYPNGDSNIYLVLSDGKWYYWNATNTAWTAGGTYLAQANKNINFYIGDSNPIFYKEVSGTGVKLKTYGSFNFYGYALEVEISLANIVSQLPNNAVMSEDNSYVEITIPNSYVLVLKSDNTLGIYYRTNMPSDSVLLFGGAGYQNSTNGLMAFAIQKNMAKARNINVYVLNHGYLSYFQDDSSGKVHFYVREGIVVKDCWGTRQFNASNFPTIFGANATYADGTADLSITSNSSLVYSFYDRTISIVSDVNMQSHHILLATNGWSELGTSLLFAKIIEKSKQKTIYIGNDYQIVYKQSGTNIVLRTYGSFEYKGCLANFSISLSDIVSQLPSNAVMAEDNSYVDITIPNNRFLILRSNNTLALKDENTSVDKDNSVFLLANYGGGNITCGELFGFLLLRNLEKAKNYEFYFSNRADVYFSFESSGKTNVYFKDGLNFICPFGVFALDISDFPTNFGASATYDNGIATITFNTHTSLAFNVFDKKFELVSVSNLKPWHIALLNNGWNNLTGIAMTKINECAINDPDTYFVSSRTFPIYDETKVEDFDALIYGKDNIDKFLFFTDPHSFGTSNQFNKKRMEYNIGTIEKAYNSGSFDFLVSGGDWLTAEDTPEQACKKLGYIKGFMQAKFKNSYLLVGNHDTNSQGTIELTQKEIQNIWYNGGNSYFDFKHGLSRCYCFDTGDDYTPDLTAYRWEQINWFANKLLNSDDDYNLLFMHIITNESLDSATIPSITAMADNILLVAQAYNNKTTITMNSIPYDFSNTTGYVKCAIGGHSHSDANGYFNGIPVILTINDDRISDTTASFDMFLMDYDNNRAYAIRYGSGSNRTINLTNGELIS